MEKSRETLEQQADLMFLSAYLNVMTTSLATHNDLIEQHVNQGSPEVNALKGIRLPLILETRDLMSRMRPILRRQIAKYPLPKRHIYEELDRVFVVLRSRMGFDLAGEVSEDVYRNLQKRIREATESIVALLEFTGSAETYHFDRRVISSTGQA